jgi:phosphopantothenoylcysteine synthetase/decarboxylase
VIFVTPVTFSLQDKKIILGVSGSIAAYKSLDLLRLLVGEGAKVFVVMSSNATKFITHYYKYLCPFTYK